MARKKHPEFKLRTGNGQPTGDVWTEERWPTVAANQPTSGCNFVLGAEPDEATKKFRAEIERRTKRLARARAKMPPTHITKGRGKKKRLVPNPDFTPAMAKKLHKLSFTAEQVREEISCGT